ncbi:hypothetical protein P781_03645 [Vibrio mimicus CAIM 1883]|nr:hypothetical protein P781_03645 [Vibrio mimicus CAIM 1883]ERM62567.1 hypothetical protein P780_03615 [Vibrio mimicus CAIM 1882]
MLKNEKAGGSIPKEIKKGSGYFLCAWLVVKAKGLTILVRFVLLSGGFIWSTVSR